MSSTLSTALKILGKGKHVKVNQIVFLYLHPLRSWPSKVLCMQPYQPARSDGNLSFIITMYNACIPSTLVNDLSNQVWDRRSRYLTGFTGNHGQLANFIKSLLTGSPIQFIVKRTGRSNLNQSSKVSSKRTVVDVAAGIITMVVLVCRSGGRMWCIRTAHPIPFRWKYWSQGRELRPWGNAWDASKWPQWVIVLQMPGLGENRQ
jgi:hypothetical protein